MENDIVKVVFVTSEENFTDPFTKNVNEKEYRKNEEYMDNRVDPAEHGGV